MSETPRTETALHGDFPWMVNADFARTLERELAAERAAREQAEIKLADERTTSDYLAAAIQMQYPPDKAIARYNDSLDKAKSRPAAALVFRKLEQAEKELERLREWFKNEYNVERCEFSPDEWKHFRDKELARAESAEKERDSLKAQLAGAHAVMNKAANIGWGNAVTAEIERQQTLRDKVEKERDALRAECAKWEEGCRFNSAALTEALRQSDKDRLEIIGLRERLAVASVK